MTFQLLVKFFITVSSCRCVPDFFPPCSYSINDILIYGLNSAIKSCYYVQYMDQRSNRWWKFPPNWRYQFLLCKYLLLWVSFRDKLHQQPWEHFLDLKQFHTFWVLCSYCLSFFSWKVTWFSFSLGNGL